MQSHQHLPDSAYAWMRLAVALIVGTMACGGSWTVVVVIPTVQAEFLTDRAGASIAYTLMMAGFASGTMMMGRIADRYGTVLPVMTAAVMLGGGYALAAAAPNLAIFALAHLIIGLGTAAGFGLMMSDISHWFVKRRGLAVVIAACGSYLAGVVWPLLMNQLMPLYGWRITHYIIGGIIMAVMLPLASFFKVQPSHATMAAADVAAAQGRADLGVEPRTLQMLLVLAGFACCMAMAMPQVHIVAYCSDLGYGVARGAEMLSLMLGLGIFSRIASGFLADRIGGAGTLMIGSLMQGLALTLYLFFNGLSSLYIISGIFGLFQGGIVPMYAVIAREYLPPREAGARIGLIIMATMVGMAAGGYMSGVIFDATASYRLAFLHGILWNLVNLALAGWLFFNGRGRALLARA
jgi:MFS family permease